MYDPRAPHLERLRAAAPGAEIVVASTLDDARRLIVDADAVLGNRFFYQSAPAAQRLRWMQSNSMGIDLILQNVTQEFTLTATRGVYEEEIAEHALALSLALVRRLHSFRDAQLHARWERRSLTTLRGRTAVVLGRGGVGSLVARMLRELGAAAIEAGRDSDWRIALPQASLLVLALPLTPSTRNLVGHAELQSLQKGAFVVNVGRGETLDESALLSSLDSGQLSGAALDVFEEEPLPPGSALWTHPDVIITPHVARSVDDERRWEPLFEENLRRFASGEPLLHAIDRSKGY